MPQISIVPVRTPFPAFSNAAGFPAAQSIVETDFTAAAFPRFALTMGSVAFLPPDFPSFSNLAGFPALQSFEFISPDRHSFASFDPNDNGTVFPNPLFLRPVMPLPVNGSGGDSGPVGYAF